MKPFSLLIKPACGDCNLRCDYCFYLNRCSLYPETASHRMTDTVLEQLVKSFLATEQAQYSFAFQGGEPTLMGLDFFKHVVALQKKYGRAGQSVANSVQTNGTLITEDLARHFAEYRFLAGVSLDGPAGIHNVYRKYADGRGTHADVMKGLGNLVRHKAEFNVLTLVHRANVGKAAEVYGYHCDNGFLFQQYIECVEFDGNGKLMPFSVSGAEWGEFLCGLYDAWIKGDTRRVSIRLFDSILLKLVDGISSCCPMGNDCRQYFVVEHNGDIYPCDFFVQPELKLGNIMKDSWQSFLGSNKYVEFGRKKSMLNEECGKCEYLSLCAGDCPKHRYSKALDPRQLSELCAGWKIFYGHSLPGFERLAQEIRKERAEEAKGRGLSGLAALQPVVPPGIGRNDPCICGSGKKYKKCCGAGKVALRNNKTLPEHF